MGRKGHCREHMLESGLSVFLLNGYNGTGVKDIVEASGVPKGSFYNHFKSKQAFAIEAVELLAERNMEHTKMILRDESKSPGTRLLTWFDFMFDSFAEESYKGGCLIGNLCLEMSDSDDEIRESVNSIIQRYINLIRDCLDEAKSLNELAVSQDTLVLAEFIHCAWEGTIMHMKASKNDGPYKTFRRQIEAYFS